MVDSGCGASTAHQFEHRVREPGASAFISYQAVRER